MRQIEVNGYKRITRVTAKKLFNEGKEIYGVPCNIRPGEYVEVTFNKKRGTFEEIENAGVYYNCNKETGRELWFYEKKPTDNRKDSSIDVDFINKWIAEFHSKCNDVTSVSVALDRLKGYRNANKINRYTYDNILNILDKDWGIADMDLQWMHMRADKYLGAVEWLKSYDESEWDEVLTRIIRLAKREHDTLETEIYSALRRVYKVKHIVGRRYD